MTKHKTDQNAVIITHHNRVTTCTLNRPDKLNALNADMVEGLLEAMKEATAKDSKAGLNNCFVFICLYLLFFSGQM